VTADVAARAHLPPPAVVRVTHADDRLRAWMLDCWVAVTAAGGAVGFLPGATADDVAPVLDAALVEVHRGASVLGLLQVDGAPAGFGFIQPRTHAVMAGRGVLLRLQVHPDQAGRGLGRRLLEGLEGLAREDGLYLLEANYRGGLGLGDFYAACGWREVGRIPEALRIAPDDLRDDVIVARWL
jgi:GNAT superfamily N-acetyltransferase